VADASAWADADPEESEESERAWVISPSLAVALPVRPCSAARSRLAPNVRWPDNRMYRVAGHGLSRTPHPPRGGTVTDQ